MAQDLHVPQIRISGILKGKRRSTAGTALRLGHYFGNSPKFWRGLQTDFGMEAGERALKKERPRRP